MDKRITFDYYYNRESVQYAFYQIPQIMIKDEYFRPLSTDAKLLYSIALSRMKLSQKSGWIDDSGRVYIYYSVIEIMKDINCAKQKAVKLLAELDGFGLIERTRQGQGKPDMIFIKHFARVAPESEADFSDIQKYENQTSSGLKIIPLEVSESNPKRYDNQTSESMEIIPLEVRESDPYTYKRYNYLDIFTESYQSNQSPEESASGFCYNREPDSIDRIRAETKERIDFDILCEENDPKAIHGICELIVDILTQEGGEIVISKQRRNIRVVQERFRQLDRFHVEYVLYCMSRNTTRINNIRAYLIAALFNSPLTIEPFYRAEVNYDMNTEKED